PHIRLPQAPRREEVPRHQREARLLAGVDRLERGAGALAAPAAYLDEDHRGPVEGHEVDLTGPAAEVALHDGVPAGAEQLRRQLLAAPPELPPPIHGSGDYSAPGDLATRGRAPRPERAPSGRATAASVANPDALR